MCGFFVERWKSYPVRKNAVSTFLYNIYRILTHDSYIVRYIIHRIIAIENENVYRVLILTRSANKSRYISSNKKYQ